MTQKEQAQVLLKLLRQEVGLADHVHHNRKLHQTVWIRGDSEQQSSLGYPKMLSSSPADSSCSIHSSHWMHPCLTQETLFYHTSLADTEPCDSLLTTPSCFLMAVMTN